MSKKIHLILTVGKNPLPVWVAWDRLTKHWEGQGHEVAVQFVHTPGSKDEKNRLKNYCHAAGATVRDDIETDARSPNRTSMEQEILQALKPDFTDLHVHYTGGTQAMGVATVYATMVVQHTLLRQQQIDIDASYLDPGRGSPPAPSSPPAIVSWKHTPLIDDTRVGVDADLTKIANLNGFQTGPFNSRDLPNNCPAPNEPSDERLEAGAVVLDNYRGVVEKEFRNNFPQGKPWWNEFHTHSHPRNDGFIYPNTAGCFMLNATDSIWEEILQAVNKAYPSCPWDCSGKKLPHPAAGSATSDQKNDLEEMDAFFTGHWLEYAAYAAFKEVLEDIKARRADRRNFKLYHNVYVAQQGTGTVDRHFELDIVAVLGYQIIVVSCSITSGISDIKQKAMEAYHRARQLGGDEARAVVLCVASAQDSERVEQELEDETGIARPLQVWGRQVTRTRGWGPVPNMDSLRSKFERLCNNDHLHWD
jgi:hypothetical protein